MPPGEAEWNATVLAGDVAEAVAKLTEQPGQNIIKYGTGEFSAALRRIGEGRARVNDHPFTLGR
jgi:hypothetical protein